MMELEAPRKLSPRNCRVEHSRPDLPILLVFLGRFGSFPQWPKGHDLGQSPEFYRGHQSSFRQAKPPPNHIYLSSGGVEFLPLPRASPNTKLKLRGLQKSGRARLWRHRHFQWRDHQMSQVKPDTGWGPKAMKRAQAHWSWLQKSPYRQDVRRMRTLVPIREQGLSYSTKLGDESPIPKPSARPKLAQIQDSKTAESQLG